MEYCLMEEISFWIMGNKTPISWFLKVVLSEMTVHATEYFMIKLCRYNTQVKFVITSYLFVYEIFNVV